MTHTQRRRRGGRAGRCSDAPGTGSTWSSTVCGLCDVARRTFVCVFGRRVCGARPRECPSCTAVCGQFCGTSPGSASTPRRLNCGIEQERSLQGASISPLRHVWPTPPLLCGKEVKIFPRVHAGFASSHTVGPLKVRGCTVPGDDRVPPDLPRADPSIDRLAERLAFEAVFAERRELQSQSCSAVSD